MRLKLGYISILSLFLLLSSSVDGFVIKNLETYTLLGKEVEILLTDKANSFEDVRNEKFQRSNDLIPNLGLTDQACWVKFNINNPRELEDLILEIDNPLLDFVQIYILTDSGIENSFIHEKTGFQHRKSKTPSFAFELPKNKNYQIFIQTYALEEIILPIKIYHSNKFQRSVNLENIIAGCFIGIIFIMFFYNLFLYFSTKERDYLIYSFYILFTGFTQTGMRGFNIFLLFQPELLFSGKSNIVFASFASVFGILFTQLFLETVKRFKGAHKALNIVIVGFAISIFLMLLGRSVLSFKLMQACTLTGTLIVLFTSYRLVVKGFKTAKIFAIAWTVLLLGVILHLLIENAVLTHNIWSKNIMLFSITLEIALLSFALANKINIYKKEKDQEQRAKLKAMQENERMIENQKALLEKQVKEKTKELTATNNELSNALDDLKSTQVSLVESEKMASLGQLTAGVAHEINNPINFVSSNVNPLIRDFEDIDEFISNILRKTEEKEQVVSEEIKKLYEELDIEYTKTEISELLNGIKEGADRTAEIVKGLKNFSRLDEAAFKTANLEEGLDSTLILLRSNMKGEIDIVKNYGGVPDIDCYAGKLNQVFMNLINNSIYAMNMDKSKEGKSGGRLILETKDLEDAIVISIEDNGTGMDEKTKEKLFEPFFTTKPVGEGTGLGMSIIYSIINDMHEGTIKVESELGEGTKTTITLPKKLKK